MRMLELCEDERPREKMWRNGAQALSLTELLAILLRTGTGKQNVVDVARELLRKADGRLGSIAEMPLEVLCEVEGIGPSKAVAVAAAFELGRRIAAEAGPSAAQQMDSPAKVYKVMLPHMRNLDHEECWVLFLNKGNRLISKEILSSGGLDATLIDKRVVVRRALERKAASIILVHNHPSGNPMPSTEDINQTRDLGKALATCGLQLLDHVVFSHRSYYSFADERLVTEKF